MCGIVHGRDAKSTGVTPFFLQHRYNIILLQLETPLGAQKKKYTSKELSDREKAELIAAKFQRRSCCRVQEL